MIKRIAAILAVAALSAACTSSNGNGSTTTTTDRATTSTSSRVESSAYTKSFCDDMASEIGDLFTEYADAVSVASDSEAALAVQVGRKLITLGRTWVDGCGHFYPASQVQRIEDNLDELESTLNEYDSIYG